MGTRLCRSTLFAVAFLFLLTAGAHAQDADPPLEPGSWYVQFSPALDDGLVTSLEGSLLSLQRQFSESVAVRVGASLRSSSTTFDNNNEMEEVETSEFGASGALLLVYYTNSDPEQGEVAAFYGGGPFLGGTRFSQTRTNINQLDQESELEESAVEHEVGWRALFGLQWFVHNEISLSAELRPSVSVSSTNIDVTYAPPDGDLLQEGATQSELHFTPEARIAISVRIP